MNFADIEREYIRNNILPEFEWTSFNFHTKYNPLSKPIDRCRVALVSTCGAYLKTTQRPFDKKVSMGMILTVLFLLRWL